MVNYNYLHLSPSEFEELARDILQVRENLSFESFKNGKDQGIDFRHIAADRSLTIVQVKRYEHYADLKKQLSTYEIAKVKYWQPARYILVTATDLTVAQKAELYQLFSPHIIQESDILVKKDLDNLLSLAAYDRVRRNHYKLWLTSYDALADSLEQLTYRKEHNLAKAEWDAIYRESKYYVQNKSFPEALDKIDQHRMVLISGTPGSGKTTLARALVRYFQAKEGYNELVYVKDTEQAWSMLKENEKQIFFYDDFLGAIYFTGFSKNEEVLLTRFIEHISDMPDKIVILTTREYVLRQAQLLHPELEKDIYKMLGYTVNPETYSSYIKAQILYNHLFFSGLPDHLILYLIEEYGYQAIIAHPNYTPRLISSYIKNSHRQIYRDGAEFYKSFIYYLDHPDDFWKDIYIKQSPAAQWLLIVLFSLNDPVHVNFLEKAYQHALRSYVKYFNDITISPTTFEQALKELSNTFISIDIENEEEGLYTVSFQNPSLKDFLYYYLKDKKQLLSVIIEGTTFLNQLLYAFTADSWQHHLYQIRLPNDTREHAIPFLLTGDLYTQHRDMFLEKFDELTLSTLEPSVLTDEKFYFISASDLLIFKLNRLYKFYVEHQQDEKVISFLIERFREIQAIYTSGDDEKMARLFTEERMKDLPEFIIRISRHVTIEPDPLLKAFYRFITFTSDYIHFHQLGSLFPDIFEKLLQQSRKIITKDVKETILDDLELFVENDLDFDINTLIQKTYPKVFQLYKIKTSSAFTTKIEQILHKKHKTAVMQPAMPSEARELSRLENETARAEEDIDQLFSRLRDSYTEPAFSSREDVLTYLHQISEAYAPLILRDIEEHDHIFLIGLLNNEQHVQVLLKYYEVYQEIPDMQHIFWKRIYDLMYDISPLKELYSREELCGILGNMALKLILTGQTYFDDKGLRIIVSFENISFQGTPAVWNNIPEEQYPFLIKKNQWIQFNCPFLRDYFAVLTISRLAESEKEVIYGRWLSQDETFNDMFINNYTFGNMLFELGEDDLKKYLSLPVLKTFRDQLNYSDNCQLIKSFLQQVNIDIVIYIWENRYEFSAFCYNEYNTTRNIILSSFDVPYQVDNIEPYFTEHINKTGMDSARILTLLQQCAAQYDELYPDSQENYHVTDFLSFPAFYELMEKIGFVDFMLNCVAILNEKITSLENKVNHE